MGVEGTGFENTMPVFELPLHFFKLEILSISLCLCFLIYKMGKTRQCAILKVMERNECFTILKTLGHIVITLKVSCCFYGANDDGASQRTTPIYLKFFLVLSLSAAFVLSPPAPYLLTQAPHPPLSFSLLCPLPKYILLIISIHSQELSPQFLSPLCIPKFNFLF